MGSFFNDEHRVLQDRFGTRSLADRLEATDLRTVITERERLFIEARDMVFLSSVDQCGRPTVSYKGGDPGFVRVIDDHTLMFPSYDGNGMFLSLGNIAGRGLVGMLFIDFETPQRLRLQGSAELVADPALLALWPAAQIAVRVTVDRLWVNCPRYVHRYTKEDVSRYVPRPSAKTPLAGWKRIDEMQDVIPPAEAEEARRLGLIDEETWVRMVDTGDSEA